MTDKIAVQIIEFQPWPKISRLNRDIVITEKIDGTNSAVGFLADGTIYAQSRTRIITPGKQTDNYGFAQWVEDNADELRAGLYEDGKPSIHFGEWWGPGIQKRYKWGVNDHKRFWLFNTHRWADDEGLDIDKRPACVGCVPVLYQGPYNHGTPIQFWTDALRSEGSVAVPGSPSEGLIVYHTHAKIMLKVTCENDEMSKGEAEARAKAKA